MATGTCDTCGHWDGALTEGVCVECINKYNIVPVETRETFKQAISNPDTKVANLERIARLAGFSIVYDPRL